MNHNSTAFRRPANARKESQRAGQYRRLKLEKKPRHGSVRDSFYNLIQLQCPHHPDEPLTVKHIRKMGIPDSCLEANPNRPDLGITLKPRHLSPKHRDMLRQLSNKCNLGYWFLGAVN